MAACPASRTRRHGRATAGKGTSRHSPLVCGRGGGRREWRQPKVAGSTKSSGGDDVRRLVIVESPAKARKIASYLGRNYVVESSKGHIRDLPRGAADVPAEYKGQPWARLGVDVDNGFEPLYIVTPDKKATVKDLKGKLKDADELYLA